MNDSSGKYFGNLSDEAWVLSIPIFRWTKVYGGLFGVIKNTCHLTRKRFLCLLSCKARPEGLPLLITAQRLLMNSHSLVTRAIQNCHSGNGQITTRLHFPCPPDRKGQEKPGLRFDFYIHAGY